MGRLYFERRVTTLQVIDIALLPQWRGRGLGTAIMEWVCALAHAAGKSVTVAVEKMTARRRCTGGWASAKLPTMVCTGTWNGALQAISAPATFEYYRLLRSHGVACRKNAESEQSSNRAIEQSSNRAIEQLCSEPIENSTQILLAGTIRF
jgi:GNAT superfamily N-acetyltransferase